MKTIKRYTVKIVTKTGMLEEEIKTDFYINEVDILGENKNRYVCDDQYYTTLEKKKNGYSTCIDKPIICSSTNDNLWGTRVTYSLYSFKAKRPTTIRREIAAYIEHKYGGFANINLDFIK